MHMYVSFFPSGLTLPTLQKDEPPLQSNQLPNVAIDTPGLAVSVDTSVAPKQPQSVSPPLHSLSTTAAGEEMEQPGKQVHSTCMSSFIIKECRGHLFTEARLIPIERPLQDSEYVGLVWSY